MLIQVVAMEELPCKGDKLLHLPTAAADSWQSGALWHPKHKSTDPEQSQLPGLGVTFTVCPWLSEFRNLLGEAL